MALFEHDIEFGKISGRKSKKMNAADSFSGNLLRQFSKGGITGKQITGGMEAQGAQLGTMVKFMKSNLRVQASTNQFTQRGFRINKDALSKATSYYALDAKVRKEERDYYQKTKHVRKEQLKKDKVVEIWRRDMLKAVGRTKKNTDTLQTAAQLRLITSVTKRMGRLLGGGAEAGLQGVNTKVLKRLKRGTENAISQQTQQWAAQSKIEKLQTGILKTIDAGIGSMVTLTERGIQIQNRANQRRDAGVREKARILESQGVGPRQTRHDAKVLKRLEGKKRRDAKKIGGMFATDEDRQARANLQREANELKTLRQRGFTRRDLQASEASGQSRSELVESGRHRRRTRRRGGGLGKFLKGTGGMGKMLGKFGAKMIPGLGLITGAALMASKAKEGDIFGSAVSGIGAAASVIPGLGPFVSIALESLAALVPGNIKEAINKFAQKLFLGAGFGKLMGGAGGGGMMADFGKMFGDLGDALRRFGSLMMDTLMSEPVQTALGKLGDFLMSAGETVIGGFTGLLNFWSDIFGGEKGFGKAFMDNIWPVWSKVATDLIPKALSFLWSVFKIAADGVKTLVVSIIGRPAAKLFGIVVDDDSETKRQLYGRHAAENEERMRRGKDVLAQISGTGGEKGATGIAALRLYNKTGNLEEAQNLIRRDEGAGVLSPDEAKKARKALYDYHDGKVRRNEAREKIKKLNKEEREEKEKTTPPTAKSDTATPSKSSSPPATTNPPDPGTAATPGGSSSGGSSLGALSAKYESAKGGASAIGFDKVGGTSFGTYQIATRTGTMKNFLVWLQQRDPAIGSALASSGNPDDKGKGNFSKTWKQISSSNPQFADYQHQFIKETHFDPAAKDIASKTGVDIRTRSKTLQDVLWSTSVQHGAGGATSIFSKVGDLSNMTDAAIVEAVYTARGSKFGSSTANVQASVQSRFANEKAEALKALGAGDGGGIKEMFAAAKGKLMAGAAQGGLSGAIGAMAQGILAQGSQMATSFASLPGMASGTIGGQTAIVIANAAKGAGMAAQQEMKNMNDAMNRALGQTPAMKKINDNMTKVSEHTRAMANKSEERDKTPLKAKKNRSLEALFSQYMSGVSFT